jgi:dipeptidyl aminopeptidase/acylaminoacyl peptidase
MLDDPNHMDVITGGFSGRTGDASAYLNAVPNAVSPDGKLLVMASVSASGTSDFSIQATSGEGTPLVSQTPAANENHATISPDGKWMAFSSDETGRYEIYIQSFPQFGRKIQVSVNGGTEPRWRGDGRELFYISSERTMMAAPVSAGEPPSPGRPVPLFPTRTPRTPTLFRRTYDVTPNGDRFLIATLPEEVLPPSITVVTGWQNLIGKEKQ